MSSNRGLWAIVVVLLCAAAIALAYAFRERQQAQQLASGQDQMSTALNQTRNQVDSLSAQLSDMNSRLAAAQQAQQAQQAAASGAVRHTSRRAAVKRDDPRFKKMQSQLDDEQKQIASTQDNLEKARTELESNLGSTRDELNGSIAKNHDELVALEKRGERNYVEFDLSRSKHFQHVGPVSISLRKTSTKHDHYNLVMLVDDREVSRKNVNLYEPILFYPPDSAQPLEVVVNQISKDHVHGYVSAPKYRKSELEKTAAGDSGNPGSTPSPASKTNGTSGSSSTSGANDGGVSSTAPASGSDSAALANQASTGPQY